MDFDKKAMKTIMYSVSDIKILIYTIFDLSKNNNIFQTCRTSTRGFQQEVKLAIMVITRQYSIFGAERNLFITYLQTKKVGAYSDTRNNEISIKMNIGALGSNLNMYIINGN